MPIIPVFDPTTGASGGPVVPTPTGPTLRSIGNLNGGSYTFMVWRE